MKLHHFGLWFNFWGYNNNEMCVKGLSTAIPQSPGFCIYYDGVRLGTQYLDFSLRIVRTREPNLLIMKVMPKEKKAGIFSFNRLLTMQDFEIAPNPDYKEYI
jgi:hypothetical protein